MNKLEAIRKHVDEQVGLMLRRRGAEEQHVGMSKAHADLLLAVAEAAVELLAAQKDNRESLGWLRSAMLANGDVKRGVSNHVGCRERYIAVKAALEGAVAALLEEVQE